MEEVYITFRLKQGVRPEDLIDTLKVLTFQEGMSYLEEQVQEFETNQTIYTNL